MDNLVSVIIPVYNASKTIEKCLDSIFSSTLENIEVIAINDCSTDDTLEKLEKYKINKNFVLINNKKNLGPAASRNKGLDKATGKYIGFVDSDDYISPSMYEMMSNKMLEDEEIDLVACSRYNVTKNGKEAIINNNTETDAKAFSKTSNYNCDKLFKREIIEKYKLRLPEKYKYAEDFSFGIRYKYYSRKMAILNVPLYYYLKDSDGSITNTYDEHIFDIINVLEDTLDFFRKENAFEANEKELITLSAGFYVRRIREFKNYDNTDLQKEFVKRFLNYFQKNFKKYKSIVNGFPNKKFRIYRCNYNLMMLYIKFNQVRRKHNGKTI